MAGHSKWANIQHRKGRQDAVRAKLFSKLSKEITVAAKMGDADPEKNPRLRLAVREAKSNKKPVLKEKYMEQAFSIVEKTRSLVNQRRSQEEENETLFM